MAIYSSQILAGSNIKKIIKKKRGGCDIKHDIALSKTTGTRTLIINLEKLSPVWNLNTFGGTGNIKNV